jgi:hypothetical protein
MAKPVVDLMESEFGHSERVDDYLAGWSRRAVGEHSECVTGAERGDEEILGGVLRHRCFEESVGELVEEVWFRGLGLSCAACECDQGGEQVLTHNQSDARAIRAGTYVALRRPLAKGRSNSSKHREREEESRSSSSPIPPL